MADQPKDSIFNGSTPESPPENQVASNQQEEKVAEASSTDPYADLLRGITSDDGRPKYATVSDAINSIPHAQTHISKLERELAEMRDLVETKAKEEQQYNQDRHLENQQNKQDASFGEDQVVGLVDRVLSQRETQQVQQKNVSTVVETLTGKFGSQEAADKAYRAKASELGISLDMFNNIASSSPKALLAYFGTTGASAPSKTEGSINTATFNQQDSPKRGNNPLLTGSMKDMQGEWGRIKNELGL